MTPYLDTATKKFVSKHVKYSKRKCNFQNEVSRDILKSSSVTFQENYFEVRGQGFGFFWLFFVVVEKPSYQSLWVGPLTLTDFQYILFLHGWGGGGGDRGGWSYAFRAELKVSFLGSSSDQEFSADTPPAPTSKL